MCFLLLNLFELLLSFAVGAQVSQALIDLQLYCASDCALWSPLVVSLQHFAGVH